MQFPAARDNGMNGWNNHDGYGDPPVYDKTLETEEFSSPGLQGAVRARKANQHTVIMDWDTDAIKQWLATNSKPGDTLAWTLNIYPVDANDVPPDEVTIETIESLNDWVEGDGVGSFDNFSWSEDTAAATTNFAQTYYTFDDDGEKVLDEAKSLPWVDDDTGTGGIDDNQYRLIGGNDNYSSGSRIPNFLNSVSFTSDDLLDAASNLTHASVELDNELVNALLNDPNNRGLLLGPDTDTLYSNWRIWTREGDGIDPGGVNDPIPGPVAPFLSVTVTGGAPTGDFNSNGSLDLPDVNMLNAEIAAGTNQASFNLNGDATVDVADLRVWVRDLRKTWFGDANLDGVFGSGDLVAIFQAGKFEVDQPATWDQGDWNGDLRFTTGDLITAFQDGGYEKGPLVAVVPEPSAIVLGGLGLALLAQRRPRKDHAGA
jgi:hypothetical protein